MDGNRRWWHSGLRIKGRVLQRAFWIVLTSFAAVAGLRAQTETVLYSFMSTPDGAAPSSGLIIDSSGNLFGTTGSGGLSFSEGGTSCTYGCGTVFELVKSASGYSESVLYSFTSSPAVGDGNKPSSGLTMDAAGNLYGETQNGSAASGEYGTVYEMAKSSTGYTYRLLHGFGPTTSSGNSPGGNLVMDAAGDLFGTTGGGGTNNGGTVFELVKSAAGYAETVLYNSPSMNVGMNQGLVMDSSGDLFGTTPYGGTTAPSCINGCGTVFELVNSSSTYTYKTLYNFAGPGGDGAQPENNLVIDGSGNLYGTTYFGGSACAPYGCGTVFELAKSSAGYSEKVLYSFAAGEPAPYDEGTGLSMDSTGDLFSTSLASSSLSRVGSAIELVKSASGYGEKVLWNFQGNPVDGGNSCSALTMDSAGHLYGTCSAGGAQGAGVVFEIDPSATPTGVTLSPASVSFQTQPDGTTGLAQLVRLTNNTNSAVTISDISVTGPDAKDFPLSVAPFGSTCSTTTTTWATGGTTSTVPVGGMCGIFPYFAPSVAGNETGTLTVTDSTGAETAALTGTGVAPDFTVGVASGSSSSATVPPGGAANYSLTVAPLGEFSQTVAFTCAGAPSEATCAVSPSSVTLDGTNDQTVFVSVMTTRASLTTPPVAPPPNSSGWPGMLWVAALALAAVAIGAIHKSPLLGKRAHLKVGATAGALAALLLVVALLASCGSGGGGGSGQSLNPGTPAGTYRLTVTGTSGSLTHPTTLMLTVQ